MKSRLGWLGPIIVALGALVGGIAVWYMSHARPVPGDYIDALAIDRDSYVAVRHERGGNRSFLEAWRFGKMMWRSLIPTYAGRPGAPALGLAPGTVTVRIKRGGRSEIFGFALESAQKIGSLQLARDWPQAANNYCGDVITLQDGDRSFEIVQGDDAHRGVASIDVTTGVTRWQTLVAGPAIVDGWLDADSIWLVVAGTTPESTRVKRLARSDGSALTFTTVERPTFHVDAATRTLQAATPRGMYTVSFPADAAQPHPNHAVDGRLLLVKPYAIEWLDMKMSQTKP